MNQRYKRLIPTNINHGNICTTRLRSYFEIERILSTKELFFVCSTGREGSSFISSFMQSSEHVICRHEPRPFCTGQHLISHCQQSSSASGAKTIQRKWSAIASEMERSNASAYIEGNHMFQKTFGRALLSELALRVNVISLRRPIVNTAKSFLDLQWFSSMNRRASNWIYKVSNISPLGRNNLSLRTELDEIFAYIISEKLNEVRFINSLKSQIKSYSRINIPAGDNELMELATLINPSSCIAKSPSHNNRMGQKKESSSLEAIQVSYRDFLTRNREALKTAGIIIDYHSLTLSISEELWLATLK